MKQIYWVILMILSQWSPAALTAFEDWQAAAVDTYVNGYNGWVGINRSDGGFWDGNNAKVAKSSDGNRFVSHTAPSWQSRGFRKPLGNWAIGDGQTATVYLSFKAEAVSPLQHHYALTDRDAPNDTGQEVLGLRLKNHDACHYRLEALDGSTFVALKTDLAANLWYHVWLVIDQAVDTYDVYLTEGRDPVQEDRIGQGLSFRYGTTASLNTFYAWAGKMGSIGSAAVCLDSIGIDPAGQSLYTLIPLGVDLTGDFFVDEKDLMVLCDRWLNISVPENWSDGADFNKSGRVELEDLALLSQFWQRSSITGLVGWWLLDDGSGVTASDVLGRNDGTLSDTEPRDWIAAGDGYVLGLDAEHETDGRGEYLVLPRLVRDNFSIAFWVRTSKIADAAEQWWDGMGMVDAEAAGLQNDFGISLLRDKAAFGVGGIDTGDVTIQSATAVNDGYWHHIAATRDGTGGQMKLYVDGVQEASGIGSVGPKDAQPRILVGSVNVQSGKYLRGCFDDIRFYDQVLSAEAIASLAAKKTPSVTPKKGVGSGTVARISVLNVEWVYNWNIARPAGMDGGIDYVPMRHNKWWPSLDNMGTIGDVDYLLGHNEPDKADQANMTVAEAVAQWPQLQAAADTWDLLLGSPSTANYNDQWIQDFMAIVDAPDSGLRVDFMCVHWYKGPNADTFMSHLNWVHDKWGRDVWLTEFNAADWDGNNSYTQEQCYTFLSEILYRMESVSWLKRYAIFPWTGTSEQSKASPVFEPGTNILTPLGRLYASWDGDIDGPDENTWYFLQHESSHQRIRSNGTEVEMTTIFSMGDWAQWKLVEAGSGWWVIENKGSSQRLGYDAVSGRPAAVDISLSDDSVKWKGVHVEHGWYRLEHKLTGLRLNYRSDLQSVTLESTASAEGHLKWRFIKP